ncbi:hypothetical protein C4J93_0672 [Pseudomonas sp. R2-37-08W]|nr:hypothetical protein C4J93_0672 [Pseudomonas sp. R2-37-08W]
MTCGEGQARSFPRSAWECIPMTLRVTLAPNQRLVRGTRSVP